MANELSKYIDGTITEVVLDSTVTSIRLYAFANREMLQSVTLPDTLTSIGASAFYWCTSLTSITCLATTPPTLAYNDPSSSSYPFYNVPSNMTVYVPAASVQAYLYAGWGNLNIQAIPS